ncbi:hypothetical protein RB195_009513 [Necator americanus]|uniref:Reverse transcriptase domain-containing protein n=1 Tax=Necator americanus TaxID=51031 RepID=A0ABR1CX05_NECAM
MLAEFDETCKKFGLRLSLDKTMFVRNGCVSDASFTLNGTNISECSSYVYLSREINMMNDVTSELGRRKRAAWGAFKSIENVVKRTKNIRLRAHQKHNRSSCFDLRFRNVGVSQAEENAISVTERGIERVTLGVTHFTQVKEGIRSSPLRH